MSDTREGRKPASDQGVLRRIEHLVREEHELLEDRSGPAPDPERLERMRVELDQCWDVLNRRRARRDAGRDPDEAEVRPAEVVESYEG